MGALAEPPIILARYAGTCPACRHVILPGMPITRHAHAHRWVHAECRNAPLAPSFPARYHGVCRACQQPIHVGEFIARDADYGWVHHQCLRNHHLSIDREAVLAEIDAIIRELMNMLEEVEGGSEFNGR
ncbi:hypothetical protein HRbin15_00489 [bacterium HR15]|nr:hypothetical protein HRbin15_00489 [bacterium HR15]